MERQLPYVTEALAPHHNRAEFNCGVGPLDRYFREQAGQDARRNVARVFVLNDPVAGAVKGYYTLSMTSINASRLPAERLRRLPRYPELPAALIGRLAVDQRYRGQRLGTLLLADALRRAVESTSQIAAYAVVVDAKDEQAFRFYEHHGFIPFGGTSVQLFIPIETVETTIPPRAT